MKKKKTEWDMWDNVRRLEKVLKDSDELIGTFAYTKKPIAKMYQDEMEGDI